MSPKSNLKHKRLSLVERQKKLLQETGFSSSQGSSHGPPVPARKPPAQAKSSVRKASTDCTFRPSIAFRKRQDAALDRMGLLNASSTSRQAEEVVFDDDDEATAYDDGQISMGGRSIISHAPSLHPSIAQSTFSRACSEVTIGAGDNTVRKGIK